MKYHSKPIFVRIKQNNIATEISQIFGEFLINYRQNVDDPQLNKYLTILVLHVSQIQ